MKNIFSITVFSLVFSFLLSGCATGSGGMKIGIENIPNGSIYSRIVVDSSNFNKNKLWVRSIEFVRNNNGRYQVYFKHYPFDTYYQVALFAKRHGYKAISFEGGLFQKWMINNIEDFTQQIENFQQKYPHRSPFLRCYLYKEIPYEVFSLDVDTFLEKFKNDQVPVVKTVVYQYDEPGINYKKFYANKIEEF